MTRNKTFLKEKTVQHKDIIKNPNSQIPPNRIRIIRIANDMDIEQLSLMLNISSSMLQQIETQKKSLSINILKKISEIFEVSTDYILYMSDDICSKDNKNDLTTDIEKLKNFMKGIIKMIRCKEFKGNGQNPDVDEAVNKFFEECDDTVDVLSVNYSTAAVPFKTSSGAVSYQVVSTCLLFLNYQDEEEE